MLKSAPRSRYSGTTVEAFILSSQGMGHVRARHTDLSPVLQADLGERGESPQVGGLLEYLITKAMRGD